MVQYLIQCWNTEIDDTVSWNETTRTAGSMSWFCHVSRIPDFFTPWDVCIPHSLSLSLSVFLWGWVVGEGGVVYIIQMTEELKIYKYELLLYHLHLLMLLSVVYNFSKSASWIYLSDVRTYIWGVTAVSNFLWFPRRTWLSRRSLVRYCRLTAT